MILTREKSRDARISPREKLNDAFPELLFGACDAEYTSAEEKHVVGACGLPYCAPLCRAMSCDEAISNYIGRFPDRNQLFAFDGSGVIHYAGYEKQIPPDNIARRLFGIYKNVMSGAGALGAQGEQIIDLKAPNIGCHYDVNLLIGDRSDYPDPLLTTPKSALDSLGRGSFRSGAAKQVSASRYTLNPEENGDPANRQIYICENGRQIFYSADVKSNVKRAVCRHFRNYSVITYETECGLEITRTIFILPQEDGFPEAVEAQIIDIKNMTEKDRKIKLVATGMFGLCSPESTMNDIIYASVTWEGGIIASEGKPVAVSPSPNPKYLAPMKRFATLICGGEFFDGYCTSYQEFVGGGSLYRPDGVIKLSSVQSRKIVPFFAMEKSADIKAGGTARFTELNGMMSVDGGDDKPYLEALSKLLGKFAKDENAAENSLDACRRFFDRFCSYIKTDTGDIDFDTYVGENLPFQVCYQSLVSRSFAWTQKAFREIGFREIQDLEAALYYFTAMGKAGLVRQMLLKWASNVWEMGYANHNFYSSGKEPGVCSDDQLWLAQAVFRYVSLTGDVAFLDESHTVAGSDKCRTVMETLTRIIEYSGKISVGANGLPLIDRGDWNDCLRLDRDFIDGPEKERRYKVQLEEKAQSFGAPLENDLSESVMNAFLLKIATDETAQLAQMSGRTELSASLEADSAALTEKIQKSCWINGYFVRALIGGGRKYKYLGSAGDGLSSDEKIDGTYYLNSFSWAILSGVAKEEQIYEMLGIIEKYLVTDAGIKLCTPAALERLDCGNSAINYFPGDRENGGVFKHATMMATDAMLSAAKTVKDEMLARRLCSLARFMLDRVLPYKTLDDPFVKKGNPRFCTQYNNSETGENIGPMLSGTASWLALTLFEMLGISYTPEKIRLSPITDEKNKYLSYTLRLGELTLFVELKKPAGFARVGENSVCLLNGNEVPFEIPRRLSGEHKVTVIM